VYIVIKLIYRDERSEMTTNKKAKKIKVGTILDAEIYERLKRRAAEVGRPISDLLQEAIIRYEQSDDIDAGLRKKALDNLFSVKFNISLEDLKEIMEEDYYDQ
jgi:predicted DNA-binding protein